MVIEEAMTGYTSSNLKKYQSRNPLKRLMIKRFNDQLAAIVMKLRPENVLEAGCGEGFIISFLSGRYPSVEFCGLDIDPGALDYARHLVPDTRLVCGDITRMPFPDGSFDLVICVAVLTFVKEPRLALRELRRVARGHVLLAVPNEPWFSLGNVLTLNYVSSLGNPGFLHRWSRASFLELVSQELEVVKTMSPFPWTLVLAKSDSV